jgi:uncharacterized protein YdbL (DUF1318 family)
MKLITPLLLTVLFAFSSSAQSMDELKARFAERLPQLRALKADGKIGETAAGAVEARITITLADSATLAEENKDRITLYRLIAQRENTTPEVVAQRNAQRNFQRATPGEWLKDLSGNWFQKK